MPLREQDLDSYLENMLTPVNVRRGFSSSLENRLLAQVPQATRASGSWQSLVVAAAGIIGLTLLLYTSIRAIILAAQKIASIWNTRSG